MNSRIYALVAAAIMAYGCSSAPPEKPRGQKIAFDHCTPEVSFAPGYGRAKAPNQFWVLIADNAVATTDDADLVRAGLRCTVNLPAPTSDVRVFFGGARTTLNQPSGPGFGAGVLVFPGSEQGHVLYSNADGGDALKLESKGADIMAGKDPADTVSVTAFRPYAQTFHFKQPTRSATLVVWVEEPWSTVHSRTTFGPIWIAADTPTGA